MFGFPPSLGFFGAPPPRPRSSVGNIWAKPLSDGSKLRIFLGMEEMEANGSGFSRRNLKWAIFFSPFSAGVYIP